MKYRLITSQLQKNSIGGINTVAKIILKSFSQVEYSNKTPIEILFIFFKDKCTNYIVIGYADKYVYSSFLLFIFAPSKVIYVPCFHPWFSMRRKFFAWLYEKFILKFFLRAKFVICLSKYESDYLKKIYHKANTYVFDYPVLVNHEIQDIFVDRNVISFIGRDDLNKNLDQFLKIAQALNQITPLSYCVVSNTERQFPDFINHFRYLDDLDLLRLYEKTKAIIITSHWESLSLVGVEAIIQGSKVVCNQNVMLGNLVNEFPSLILNDYSSIDGVLSFLNIPVNQIELAQFRKRFSMQSFVSKFGHLLA